MNLPINTKITWRTNGRGVTRTFSGTIIALVKRGTVPKTKSMQEMMPHGTKLSNRDRYIVEVKDGVFQWANCNTCVEKGQKLPAHKPRKWNGPKAKKSSKTKVKAKKAKAKKAKAAPKAKKPAKVAKTEPTFAEAFAKTEKKADKPKTTWYGIVDGKVVSVRKVICPEGFSKDKPAAPAAPVAPAAPAPAAIGSVASDLPTA
jgi:hypothetical protein